MKRKPVGKIIVNILVILLCCVWLVPVYMVIVNAFKSRAELYENIFAFPKHFTLEYFQGALKKMDFLMAFRNSNCSRNYRITECYDSVDVCPI